jgi:predicted Rossmann-fold nucleotide-binding protein
MHNEDANDIIYKESSNETIDASIRPRGTLDILSKREIEALRSISREDRSELLQNCALAVLSCGGWSDDYSRPKSRFPDFSLEVHQNDRGLRLELKNAPADAFVDGEVIEGIAELLGSVVRDIAFIGAEIDAGNFDENTSRGITDSVFGILRHAHLLVPRKDPNLVVCWGGHSIKRPEYEYTKKVGYELGLRGMDICTGCGPGAMKGPMKGANIAHAKQRHYPNRYIGITEPGIISAEPPNAIVNNLVIMPDIEKRLEAFVRLSHGIIVFPGGAGTAEEILYILSILLHPENQSVEMPLIFTGPEGSKSYFEELDAFIRLVLGDEAAEKYKIIIENPVIVAREMAKGHKVVKKYRKAIKDAYYYNWSLMIDESLQHPFEPTHDNMTNLNLRRDQPIHELAANMRRAFSGIVAGNVKAQGIELIKAHGRYQIQGDSDIMEGLDKLLQGFVDQGRMKLPGSTPYEPCYDVLTA